MIKDNFSKYSDKTAPYNKCLELITPTEVTAINAEAPPEVSVSSFTNGGGDNLWSNVANWDNGIPNVPTAKVTLKANLILDSDVTLGQIKLAGGFGNVSVTSSNNIL